MVESSQRLGAAMKKLFILAAVVWLLGSTTGYSVEMAHARLFCYSLQFQQATTYDSYGFRWQLNLTTLSSGDNGELAPYFLTTSYTHSSYVEIYSELYDETDQGAIGLNVPDGGDANGDGFSDFFEVSQGVTNLTSSGVLESQDFYPGNGTTFQATWNRAAGSTTGTCSFQVYDPSEPLNSIQYTINFNLLEYTGPLTYTPGSNTVSANINLTQTGNPANTLQGPILFDKSPTNRFNTLINRPGFWTNAAMQTLTFTNEIFSRDPTWPTNYYGYVEFADGDPSTADPDYTLWVLSIDDTNDANGNGIPDFSDDVTTVLPTAPQLSLGLGVTNVLLTISGDVGRTNEIQETTSLISAQWQTTLSLVLTNSPQVVSLPLPSGQTKFWRVQVE
jgi:hypothetical protein